MSVFLVEMSTRVFALGGYFTVKFDSLDKMYFVMQILDISGYNFVGEKTPQNLSRIWSLCQLIGGVVAEYITYCR